MLTTFQNDTLFIMPLCFHPTTTMLVDDDQGFLNDLSDYFVNQLPVLPFNNPIAAIDYINNKPTLFKDRCYLQKNGKKMLNIGALRNEIYNANRFKEIMTSVIDYNMPNKTGFDLMQSMGLPFGGMENHSYILLTGTPFSEINKEFSVSHEAKNYISKASQDYQSQLFKRIEETSAQTSQWYSYDVARSLTLDPQEKTNFLFDGNFLPILNAYIKANNICEFYLFDKQGSFLFLDKDANFSWLFIRSDLGIENTITRALKYNAPKQVIDALKSKEVILSLYEVDDFETKKSLDWNKYLLPATVFSGNDSYLKFFNLTPRSDYYYTFVNNFHEHGLNKNKILSYQAFLDQMV